MYSKILEWHAEEASSIPALDGVAEHVTEIVRGLNSVQPVTGASGSANLAGMGTVVREQPIIGPLGAVVKITGSSGAGQYTGRIFYGDFQATVGNSPDSPFGLTDPGSDDCLFINLAEFDGTGPGGVQAGGNLLLKNQWVAGIRCGYSTGSYGQQLQLVAGTCRGPSRTWAGVALAGSSWVTMTDAVSATLNTFNSGSVPWVGNQNVLAISVLRFQAALSNATTNAFLWKSIFSDGPSGTTCLSATVAPNSQDNNYFGGTITTVQLLQQQPPQNISASGFYSEGDAGPCTATGVQGQADIYVFGL